MGRQCHVSDAGQPCCHVGSNCVIDVEFCAKTSILRLNDLFIDKLSLKPERQQHVEPSVINRFRKCFTFARKLGVKKTKKLTYCLQAFKEFPSTAVVAALCKYLVLCLLKNTLSNMPCFFKSPLFRCWKFFFFSPNLDMWDSGGVHLHFCLIGAYLNTPGIPYAHFAIWPFPELRRLGKVGACQLCGTS